MKIMFFQTGNYAEAYQRMTRGEPESYRDQNLSVEYVARLAPAASVTTVAVCPDPHDRTLAPGLRSVGLRYGDMTPARVAQILDEAAPDRLILRSPFVPVLQQAKARAIPTLPCFADLFQRGGPRSWLRTLRLRRALSGPNISCLANHSLNASRSAVEVLGWPQDRVVPWDWSRLTPDPDAKSGLADPSAPRLFYAGALSAEKGVGDCLEALRLLRAEGCAARMSFAGKGDVAHWQAEVNRLGLGDAVTFLGLIPNTDVRAQMAAHDLVVVPSRHSYPEGLPNTIYEALASRSALLLSDHPAFRGRIAPDQGAMTFEASNPRALAAQVTKLRADPDLYAALSTAAPDTLEGLYIGLEWSTLVDRFLADPTGDTGWIAQNALPRYNS